MEVARVKLKWNNHQCVFSHYLKEYCNQPRFSDAMIACEEKIFMVHRIILSTCSHYFDEIFQKTPVDNIRPVIILNDTPVEVVQWLLSYMYCGEVTVPQNDLSVLFKLAEQLKVKGLYQLQVPDLNKSNDAPGNTGSQDDNDCNRSSSKLANALKRKFSDSSNVQHKKPASFVSAGPLANTPSYGMTFPLPTVPITSFHQASSPLILTNSVSGSLPSSNMTKPPKTQMTNAKGNGSVTPPNVDVSGTVLGPSLPIVTIPVSALPSNAQTTTISCKRLPVLAPRPPKQSQSIVSSSGPATLLFAPTGERSGSDTAVNEGNAVFNFMPAGTDTEHPLLTEIKEEVKEEPLTLGPDDPISMDDDDTNADDDFSSWGADEISPVTTSNSYSTHLVVIPTEAGAQREFTSKKKEEEGEGLQEKENKEAVCPSRPAHVLPQIVQPFIGLKKISKVTAIDSRSSGIQHPQWHTQGNHQMQPSSEAEEPLTFCTSPESIGIKKTFIPQKVPDKDKTPPCKIKVIRARMSKLEYEPPAEVIDLNAQSEKDNQRTCNVTVGKNINEFEDDAGLREMMEFIKEGGDDSPVFYPINSEKKKNQPYLIRSTKIATKNEEPVKFCLRGAKLNQVVTVCMRYTEEKYKRCPVHSCKLHTKDEGKSNFQVTSPCGTTVMYRKDEEGHPTAYMVISKTDLDEASNFIFFVTFVCLNSCHKGNGKKMDLVCKILEPSNSQVIKQNNFEVRVCKNVKRDYKDVISGDEKQVFKIFRRSDNFLYSEEVGLADGKIAIQNNPLASGSGGSQSTDENMPVSLAEAVPLGKKLDSQGHDIFLIRLPNSKGGKIVLDLVRELEKNNVDLDSSPATQEEQDAS